MLMRASHHELPNFSGFDDARYQSLQTLLRDLALDCLAYRSSYRVTQWLTHREAAAVADVLGANTEPCPKTAAQARLQDSPLTEWFFSRQEYQNWASPLSTSRQILLLEGTSFSGKSSIAVNVIHKILSSNVSCQYHLLQENGQRLTLDQIIRNLTYQFSLEFPAVARTLIRAHSNGDLTGDRDPRVLWKRAISLLNSQARSQPIYWVIDGLDLSSAPEETLKGLCEICSEHHQLRVFLTSHIRDSSTSQQLLPIDTHIQPLSLAVYALHDCQVTLSDLGLPAFLDALSMSQATVHALWERFQGNLVVS